MKHPLPRDIDEADVPRAMRDELDRPITKRQAITLVNYALKKYDERHNRRSIRSAYRWLVQQIQGAR